MERCWFESSHRDHLWGGARGLGSSLPCHGSNSTGSNPVRRARDGGSVRIGKPACALYGFVQISGELAQPLGSGCRSRCKGCTPSLIRASGVSERTSGLHPEREGLIPSGSTIQRRYRPTEGRPVLNRTTRDRHPLALPFVAGHQEVPSAHNALGEVANTSSATIRDEQGSDGSYKAIRQGAVPWSRTISVVSVVQ